LQSPSFRMHQTPQPDYLARRHRESVERGEAASDPAIGRVHRKFAQLYATKLDGEPRPAGR